MAKFPLFAMLTITSHGCEHFTGLQWENASWDSVWVSWLYVADKYYVLVRLLCVYVFESKCWLLKVMINNLIYSIISVETNNKHLTCLIKSVDKLFFWKKKWIKHLSWYIFFLKNCFFSKDRDEWWVEWKM